MAITDHKLQALLVAVVLVAVVIAVWLVGAPANNGLPFHGRPDIAVLKAEAATPPHQAHDGALGLSDVQDSRAAYLT